MTKVHRADWPLRSCIGGERGPYRLVTSVARIRCPVAFLASSDRLVLEKLDTSPRDEIIVEFEAAREDVRPLLAGGFVWTRDSRPRGKDFDPAHVRIFAVHVVREDGDLEEVGLQRLSARAAVSVIHQDESSRAAGEEQKR